MQKVGNAWHKGHLPRYVVVVVVAVVVVVTAAAAVVVVVVVDYLTACACVRLYNILIMHAFPSYVLALEN